MRFRDLLNSRCYDLGHSLDRKTPVWPSHPPFFMTLSNRHGDIPDPGECGYGSANEVIVTSGHHSTHIDALGHVSEYGKLYGDVEASTVQIGEGYRKGLNLHGVETIPPIVKRGVLLDVAELKGRPYLEPGEPITDSDLEEATHAEGVAVEPGDCVLIRTGWSHWITDGDMYLGRKGGIPGPDVSAARWLAGHRVFLAGTDTLPFELRCSAVPGLPVHQELIAKNGIHIVESLQLEELSQDRVREFVFVALPLKITGATGSPIRPIALV